VRQVLPRVEFSGLISNGDKSTVMIATGVDPDAEFAVKGPFLKIDAGERAASSERGRGDARARPRDEPEGRARQQPDLAREHDRRRAERARRDGQGVFSTGVPDIDKRLVYTDIATRRSC
jgi:putative ABC transport system permease protein